MTKNSLTYKSKQILITYAKHRHQVSSVIWRVSCLFTSWFTKGTYFTIYLRYFIKKSERPQDYHLKTPLRDFLDFPWFFLDFFLIFPIRCTWFFLSYFPHAARGLLYPIQFQLDCLSFSLFWLIFQTYEILSELLWDA